jgi:hypothetical protein
MKVEYLPDLFVDDLFDTLTYSDILKLTKVPEMRNVVIDFYTIPSNLKKLHKKIIVECLGEYVKNNQDLLLSDKKMNTILEDVGYVTLNKNSIAKKMVFDFIKQIEPWSDVQDFRDELERQFYIPYEWIHTRKDINPTVKKLAKQLEKELNNLKDKSIFKFIYDLQNAKLEILEDLQFQLEIFDYNHPDLKFKITDCKIEEKITQMKLRVLSQPFISSRR